MNVEGWGSFQVRGVRASSQAANWQRRRSCSHQVASSGRRCHGCVAVILFAIPVVRDGWFASSGHRGTYRGTHSKDWPCHCHQTCWIPNTLALPGHSLVASTHRTEMDCFIPQTFRCSSVSRLRAIRPSMKMKEVWTFFNAPRVQGSDGSSSRLVVGLS